MGMVVRKWILLLFIIALGGCAASEQIRVKSQSERTDVFREVPKETPPSEGFADLTIRASLKTHLEGFYLVEFGDTRHGETRYPFLINVDGQAAIWEVDGQRETVKRESAKDKNPEAGEGMRYLLEKRIRLAPGPHRVFFSLPSEKVALEIEIVLVEGNANDLQFKPVYRSRRISRENFLYGILTYKAFFGGKFIKPSKPDS